MVGNECNYPTPADANKNNVVTLNLGAVASSNISYFGYSIVLYNGQHITDMYDKNFRDDERNDFVFCYEKIRVSAVKCPFCNYVDPFQDTDTLKSSELNAISDAKAAAT
eukprot:NODE_17_length_41373_cov_0.337016.p30 type:complete len:109 gc:universal NODE_17_length_41373_cov_0.337016:16749-16423(-)